MAWDIHRIDLTDISCDGPVIPKIGLVGVPGVFVPFRRENAAATDAFHRMTQTADTGEEIDECELFVHCHPLPSRLTFFRRGVSDLYILVQGRCIAQEMV
jgi:hypothetical protein